MSRRTLMLGCVWGSFTVLGAAYVWMGSVPFLARVQPYAYLIGPAAPAAATAAAWFRSHDYSRRTWAALALASFGMLVGETYYGVYQAAIAPAGPPVPSLADGAYLFGYAFLFLAVLLLAEPGSERLVARIRYGADQLLLMVVSFSVAMMLAIRPTYLLYPGAGMLERLIRGSYPVLDLWLLCLLALVSFGIGRETMLGWKRLMPLAIGLYAIADFTFNYTAAAGLYKLGDLGASLTDVVWLAAYFAVFLGAVLYMSGDDDAVARSKPHTIRPERPASWWDLSLVAIVLGSIVFFSAMAYASRTEAEYWDYAISVAAVAALMAVRSTALVFENDMLSHRSVVDPLTGLYNHRHFHECLSGEVERARRAAEYLTLVMLDLDGFSEINTVHGHSVGDKRLRVVAERLRRVVRAGDIVCRVGGDEFAIVLPATDSAEARQLCVEVLAAVNESDGVCTRPIGMSAGLATYPIHADSIDDLFRKADGALYWAKSNGRDQVVVYDEDVVTALDAEQRIERMQEQSFAHLVGALAAAVDARDAYTQSHSRNVARLAAAFAEHLGYEAEQVRLIETAALLHDVGKIGVPDSVLSKPAGLNAEEQELIRAHPALSAKILGTTQFTEILTWVTSHHECWDGTGYPEKLRAEAIPRQAQIIALCDTYDAMTSDRPYRSALTPAEALDEVRRCAGSQFDPSLVEPFVETVVAVNHIRYSPTPSGLTA